MRPCRLLAPWHKRLWNWTLRFPMPTPFSVRSPRNIITIGKRPHDDSRWRRLATPFLRGPSRTWRVTTFWHWTAERRRSSKTNAPFRETHSTLEYDWAWHDASPLWAVMPRRRRTFASSWIWTQTPLSLTWDSLTTTRPAAC